MRVLDYGLPGAAKNTGDDARLPKTDVNPRAETMQ
jgi:hypothetical protein